MMLLFKILNLYFLRSADMEICGPRAWYIGCYGNISLPGISIPKWISYLLKTIRLKNIKICWD